MTAPNSGLVDADIQRWPTVWWFRVYGRIAKEVLGPSLSFYEMICAGNANNRGPLKRKERSARVKLTTDGGSNPSSPHLPRATAVNAVGLLPSASLSNATPCWAWR
jgi:hypothetical protein